MMKEEFEKIAGYEVSFDDYNNIIEPMYMATNLTKQEFVKTISKKRFALKPAKRIIKEMQEIAEELKETCFHYYNKEAKDKLDDLAEEYIARIGYERIAHYQIETKQYMSCYYPAQLVIYSKTNYKTIQVIDLVA